MSYIVKQKASGNRINIYLAENNHIPEKGPRQTRIYIGVLDTKTNELILSRTQPEPNETLIELLSSKNIFYKGKKSSGRGRKRKEKINNEANQNMLEKIKNAEIIETGRNDALDYVAHESGLFSSLEKTFGTKDANQILSIAKYQASETMPLYLAAEWSIESGIEDAMSSSSISRKLDEIGANSDKTNQFFTYWIEACGKPKSVLHDTTSISSYSETLEEVEWGYNRDREELPQINLALVVDKKTELPIWFRPVSGSIPDVASLKNTCKILKNLGLSDFSISLDRGYFSTSNVLDLKDNNIDFIIGVPSFHLQSKQLILNSKDKINSYESSFLLDGKRLRHTKSKYIIKNKETNKSETFSAHLFCDPKIKENIIEKIEISILEVMEKFKNKKFPDHDSAISYMEENSGKLKKFFKINRIENNFKLEINIDELNKFGAMAGVALILSSKNDQENHDVLKEYRCKDAAEKIFDILKNGIHVDRLRTSSSDQMNGRLFISFISLILRKLIEDKLRNSKLLSKYSVDEALTILKKIKKIKLKDNTYINQEIPKKSREIKEAIELRKQNTKIKLD